MSREPIERNLAMELVRVTEAAAMGAARFMGRNDKIAADQAAVDAMRYVLQSVSMDGVIVIGEGEKDEAPMLYIGEEVGNKEGPATDVAVDPIDGTRPLAFGQPNSLAVVALASRGSMLRIPHEVVYMEKLAVGPEAAGKVDIRASITENLRRVAEAKQRDVEEVTVVILDRPRHEEMIREIRAAGARIKLINDGDVAGAIMAAMDDYSGVDILLGIGGSPEAILAACAVKCIGGDMQCRFYFRSDSEREATLKAGLDPDAVFGLNDLVDGDDIFFAATGITDGGEMLRGVRYTRTGARTESMVMRCRSGTIRHIEAHHNFKKLAGISGGSYSHRHDLVS